MNKNIAKWPLGLLDDVVSDKSYGSQRTDPPKDLELAVQYLVEHTLRERETKVITAYYKDDMSYEQISIMVGVSVERIRQIKSRAIRKLRHPVRFIFIRDGLQGGMEYFQERKYQQGYSEGFQIGYTEASNRSAPPDRIRDFGVPVPPSMLPGSILELGLNVRATNALWRAGIKTVGDLMDTPVNELQLLRNIGEKTLAEIMTSLKAHGYHHPCDGWD